MSGSVTRPYSIADHEVVSMMEDLRVQILTLAEGEKVPWHYHSEVTDIFIGLEGTTVVETRVPRARYELRAGEHCVVPVRTAHEVTGKAGEPCRFTLVQGVGTHDFVPVGKQAKTEP
ncbi:MAG: hypothetical protein Kilf2KO_17390 [Rhodospirillales bacterium]